MQSISRNLSFLTGANLLLSVALCYVVAALAYLVGGKPVDFALPVAFLLSSLLILNLRPGVARWMGAVALALAAWGGCALLAAVLFDSSCDGNLYHLEAVADLFNGWNPYRDPLGVETDEPWVLHYPKAMEMVGACLMGLTGSLQSSKAAMMVLALAMLFLTPKLIDMTQPGIGRRRAWLLALLIAANPVVVSQMLRFYIDDVVYIAIVLTLLLSLAVLLQDKLRRFLYLLLAATVVIAAGTKLNALFYSCLTAVMVSIGCAIYRRRSGLAQYLGLGAAMVALSFILIAYHPYVTNWQTAGHPLYPLAGADRIDIMSGNTPVEFAGSNRFVNFIRSVYSPALPHYAPAAGGFMPLFILMLPLAAAIVAADSLRRRRFTPEAYALVCLLGSCFVFEQSWWARYIPQLWLVGPLAVGVALRGSSRLVRGAGKALAAMGLLTGAVCLLAACLGAYRFTLRRQAVFEVVAPGPVRMASPQPQFVRMFEEQGIAVQSVAAGAIAADDREMMLGPSLNDSTDPWFIELTPEARAELDFRLRQTAFYRLGVKIRKFIGKDENIPFYN